MYFNYLSIGTGEDELQREERGDPQALGRRQPGQQVRRQGGQAGEDQGQGAGSEDRLNIFFPAHFKLL